MKLKLLRPIGILFLLLLTLRPANGQQTVEPHNPQNNDVLFAIRFADGKSSFHVGEVIPLELSFSTSVPDTYDYSTRNYDRSGRLNLEQFHVTPPGRDPLHDYFAYGSFIGGGLSGSDALSDKPYVLREEMNEWVALDRPGHYSMYVTSWRVTRRVAEKNESIELRSNTLEFEVAEANSAWQQQTLISAVAKLTGASSSAEERAEAARTLRFLDSPESIQELVRLLGAPSNRGHWDAVAGLAGARDQALVVHELERQMNSPEIGLSQDYLFILPKLKVQLDHGPLPPYPEKDVQQQKIWQEHLQARDKELNQLSDALYDRAAALVFSKSGEARTETVSTLLMRPTRELGTARPLANVPPGEVVSAFLNLPPDQQWMMLLSFWARLKIPAMVKPLKKVAQLPDTKHQMLRDMVLSCLYDLDPKAAAPIFLEEIRHPHLDNGMFTVRGATLGLLAEETLPQFDELLAARLQQKESRTLGLDAQLVARYSTSAILAKVKSAYEAAPGQWDCVTEDGFVLYFLRVDPDYGVKRLAVAPSACMTNSLPAVIKMHRWNEVEPGVIAWLNGADLNRAGQAAETLAKYGSSQAQAAVWNRLRRFHAEWAERLDELTYRPNMPREANAAWVFHGALVSAIVRAQAWLVTDEKIDALESMTLPVERDGLKQMRWTSPVAVNIFLVNDQVQWSINQYSAQDASSLCAKLAQFPFGTKFSVNIFGPEERVSPVLAAINEVATAHGFDWDRPQKNQ